MSLRRVTLVSAVALAGVLAVAGCSDSESSTSTTTTTEAGIGGNVVAPVILTPAQPTATVEVGRVVTFDMGDPNGGTFVATSDQPAVFEVTGEGGTDGSATFNAGGRAVGVGVAEVVVQFHGAVNGLGSPTTFTITVE